MWCLAGDHTAERSLIAEVRRQEFSVGGDYRNNPEQEEIRLPYKWVAISNKRTSGSGFFFRKAGLFFFEFEVTVTGLGIRILKLVGGNGTGRVTILHNVTIVMIHIQTNLIPKS